MSLEGFTKQHIVEKLRHEMQSVGLEQAIQIYLEAARIQPVSVLETKNPEAFNEYRQRLATEPGIIIANHPGFFDTPLILSTLKRNDVKIIVSKSNFAQLAPIIGSDHLVEVSDEPDKMWDVLNNVKTHIHSGGVVLLYPTGGGDRVDKGESFEFEGGFSVLVRKCLRPTDMVYSFWVHPEDIQPLIEETISRNTGAASAFAFGDAINPNRFKQTADIKFDEVCDNAESWQRLITEQTPQMSRADRNKKLAEHFRGQFSV